ncbi:MAG TPA: hypothetical protein VHN19_12380, partial [Burkholderiales bacterium]|nr:hypothetical protein [Burkholderiales bacterium]
MPTMLLKHTLIAVTFGSFCAASALAADVVAPSSAGFYGGVSVRESGAETSGIRLGHLTSAWGHFTSPITPDPSANRSLAFGGYRFGNDVAV